MLKKIILAVAFAVTCSSCVREGDSVHMSYVYDPETDLCFTVTLGQGLTETFSNVPCTPKVLAKIKAENQVQQPTQH